jgi:pimeloyl-ACP methyl ester carboxylesterase
MVATLILVLFLAQSGDGIVERKTTNGLTTFTRVPGSYNPKIGAPALVWLHGSNANSREYIDSFSKQAWLRDWILIGINGETGSKEKGFNYTFESAPLLAAAFDELTQKLKVSRAFIGGHSQGAYVTFSVVMSFPEKFAGAIPVAGGLWMQCEPERYKEAELEKRKGTAIAIVHGRKDDVVDIGLSEGAHFSFVDAGFPMVRFFDSAEATHMFFSLPVKDAIEWCAAIAERDAKKLGAFALAAAGERRWRDATVAAQRSKAGSVQKAAEREAAGRGKALAARMAKEQNDSWVRDFWAYRTEFQFTDVAKPLLDVYAKLRGEHDQPAENLFFKARGDFEKNRDDDAYKSYEEIVKKYYGSRWYFYAKRGLEKRKK